MQLYTKEEVETYIEYAKKLWDTIEKTFDGDQKVQVESTRDSDSKKAVDDYIDAMQKVLSPIKHSVFGETLLHFSSWLFHDCPLTGHKGRENSVGPVPTGVYVTSEDLRNKIKEEPK